MSGICRSRRPSKPKRRPRHCACKPRIFTAPTLHSQRKHHPCSKVTDSSMTLPSYLHWPFFEARHRELYSQVTAWSRETLGAVHTGAVHTETRDSVDALCLSLVR